MLVLQSSTERWAEAAALKMPASISHSEQKNYDVVETIVAKCIDSTQCMEYGQYRQALDVAIETKRLDVFNVCTDSSYNTK